jgi:hypothetical protein
MQRPQWDNTSVTVQESKDYDPSGSWTHRGEGFLVGIAMTLAFIAWRLTKK